MSNKVSAGAVKRGGTSVKQLPVQLEGTVTKGFGRGSKELGCPTANISIEPYQELLVHLPVGVYYGFAQVDDGPIYTMAMSIGWNPYYKNSVKTIEVHIMHKFDNDFYGHHLKALALGYIRPELDFKSLEDLILAIKEDIKFSEAELAKPRYHQYRDRAYRFWSKTAPKAAL